MNINKVTRGAEQLWDGYRKSDPLMMKKTFSMKDVFYRKSAPGRELWHAEVSFDYDFYLAVLVGVLALMAMAAAVCRLPRRFRFRPMRKRKRA